MASRHAHRDDFMRLAEGFGRRELLATLGIDRATLRRWQAGRSRIPWAAYRLLFELSPYGRAERDAMENFQRACLLQLVEALQGKVERLEAQLVRQAQLVDWGCANDPFAWPTDPRTATARPRAAPERR